MLNIPTDLLRTLVAVVDLRSFTKAAQSLGVTQPAVSAQIKRLQFLLGYELLDKSAPGVSLTPRGDIVVGNARRMLSINDQILHLTGSRSSAQTLRVGIPRRLCRRAHSGDAGEFPQALARHPFQRHRDDLRQHAARPQAGRSRPCISVSRSRSPRSKRVTCGSSRRSGCAAPHTVLDPNGPVPLVSFGEDCPCRYTAVNALAAGRPRLRLRVHVAQHCQPGGGGRRRARRHGAAAQPGRADRALDLGGRAAAGVAGTLLRRSSCAKAATGRRSRSLPTTSRRPCGRSRRRLTATTPWRRRFRRSGRPAPAEIDGARRIDCGVVTPSCSVNWPCARLRAAGMRRRKCPPLWAWP